MHKVARSTFAVIAGHVLFQLIMGALGHKINISPDIMAGAISVLGVYWWCYS